MEISRPMNSLTTMPSASTSQVGPAERSKLLRPIPALSLRAAVIVLLVVGIGAWSVRGTKAEPASLIAGVPNMVDFVKRLFPIEFDWTAVAALPVDVKLPFTIRANKTTDVLNGDAEQQRIQEELAKQVPLDELIASGEAMPETTLAEKSAPAKPDEPAAWFSWEPSVLNRLWVPGILPFVVETLQMALVGTLLAVLVAIPFGLLAARNTAPHPMVYQLVRLAMNAGRAVPELIYALIFVAAVGLGPFTGVLALSVASVGSIGRLYAEAIEQIDPAQVQAVRATGASGLHVFCFSVIPQVLPLIATYSLSYFEYNVRAASILGVVGAGGVGLRLNQYMSLFQFRELMGAIVVLVIAVTIIDRGSAALRKSLI